MRVFFGGRVDHVVKALFLCPDRGHHTFDSFVGETSVLQVSQLPTHEGLPNFVHIAVHIADALVHVTPLLGELAPNLHGPIELGLALLQFGLIFSFLGSIEVRVLKQLGVAPPDCVSLIGVLVGLSVGERHPVDIVVVVVVRGDVERLETLTLEHHRVGIAKQVVLKVYDYFVQHTPDSRTVAIEALGSINSFAQLTRRWVNTYLRISVVTKTVRRHDVEAATSDEPTRCARSLEAIEPVIEGLTLERVAKVIEEAT